MADLGTGLYCESVVGDRSELTIGNALDKHEFDTADEVLREREAESGGGRQE